MSDTLRLGSGSGFWGDAVDPAVELLERGQLDYLGLDFLAELTLALLQRQRIKNTAMGYPPDLAEFFRELLPVAARTGTRIVCNGGGVNPIGAGQAIRDLTDRLELGLKIAAVTGDDVLDKLDDLRSGGLTFPNLDSGEESIDRIRERIVSANAYTGAEGIIRALRQKADVVIAGRVSDSALYIGPIMHEFNWRYSAAYHDRIASAITLGHVIECSSGTTGGMSSRWEQMPNMGRVGFPLVEVSRDGSGVVTKVEGSGGRVDQFTVKEHLTYETLDPRRYMAPDGVADFTALQVEEVGHDRVRLSGMSGSGRPDDLKLLIGYEDGWIGEGLLFFPWPDAFGRAEKARRTLLERFERMDLKSTQIQFDYIGVNMLHGPASPPPRADLNEVGLRVAVRAESLAEAEKVRRACTHLWIMGPGGTSFGTPLKPRQIVSIWPTLIPRKHVHQSVTMIGGSAK